MREVATSMRFLYLSYKIKLLTHCGRPAKTKGTYRRGQRAYQRLSVMALHKFGTNRLERYTLGDVGAHIVADIVNGLYLLRRMLVIALR